MNALQQPRQTLEPVEQHRRVTKQREISQRRRSGFYAHQGMAIENTAKLVVYIVMVAGGVSALVRLLPYNISQQAKLQEISTEVQVTENRVANLQNDFKRSFDPQQSKKIMGEQSNRVDPKQRPVFLVK